MANHIEITKDTLTPGIKELMPDIHRMVNRVFEYWSTKAVSDMRSNARWQDQTGNARNGLSGSVFDNDQSIELVLYHRMPYGVFLEIRWSGKYAIIGPTMASVAPQLAQMISRVLAEGGR